MASAAAVHAFMSARAEAKAEAKAAALASSAVDDGASRRDGDQTLKLAEGEDNSDNDDDDEEALLAAVHAARMERRAKEGAQSGQVEIISRYRL
eukprot:4178271-Pleurochrysis_carterae.AAC.3